MADSAELPLWFSRTLSVVQGRPRDLFPPAAASAVVMMLIFVVTMGVTLVGTVGLIVLVAQHLVPEWAMSLLSIAVVFFILPPVMLLSGVLFHALCRYTLAILRGHEAPVSLLVPTLGGALQSAVLMGVTISVAMLGTMMCIIPGYLAGAMLMLAPVALADRGQGLVDAIAVSWELSRPRILSLLLFNLASAMVITFISYIPVVGWMVAMPLYTVGVCVVYLSVTGELTGGERAAP